MQVSIERVQDPELSSLPELKAAPGNRLVSVAVHVNNTGTTSFPDNIEASEAWVYDTEGRRYPRDPAMSWAMQKDIPVPIAPLDPKWEATRVMVFEVRGNAPLTRFRLGRWAGVASRTQDWELA